MRRTFLGSSQGNRTFIGGRGIHIRTLFVLVYIAGHSARAVPAEPVPREFAEMRHQYNGLNKFAHFVRRDIFALAFAFESSKKILIILTYFSRA